MAHTRSAEKSRRQAVKRTLRNRMTKSNLKTVLKKVMAAVEAGDAAKAGAEFRLATQLLDKAARDRTIHANEAARRKSRIARRIAALQKK
jgi:small subunit ribosomal protein S20